MPLYYQDKIRETLARTGNIGANPRHVECYMRLVHPTLDGLSAKQFEREVIEAVEDVEIDGADVAEKCARSAGLW